GRYAVGGSAGATASAVHRELPRRRFTGRRSGWTRRRPSANVSYIVIIFYIGRDGGRGGWCGRRKAVAGWARGRQRAGPRPRGPRRTARVRAGARAGSPGASPGLAL